MFAAHLSRLSSDHPSRAKWVIVPTHGIGRMLGDRLVQGGTNWANLRFVTPLDLALRMGAPFLVERGLDPSGEGLGPALMMRLLLGLPDEPAYFQPLAAQPQLAISLWSTVRELRMAGVRAADLSGNWCASARKREEVVGLLEAYERFLVVNRRGDRSTVFDEALAHPDWCPVKPADCWTAMPDVVWSVLEQRLIDLLPGEALPAPPAGSRVAAAASPRPPLPRRLKVSSGFHRPDPFPSPVATTSVASTQVAFFTAGGPEAEVEEVVRRILASGARLDDVEIACASPDYAPLVWEKACRYDWPVTLAAGLPATLTRPGRALLAFAEWIEDDFAAGRLRRMLESGDVQFNSTGDSADIAAGRAARLLVRARAAWGRNTYRLATARVAKAERARATRDDADPDTQGACLRRADEAEALGRAIDAVIALVPEANDRGEVEVQALVAGARRFLDRHAVRTSALDTAAGVSLDAALGELAGLGDFRCSTRHALRFIRERVESLTVGADRARPGHLYVSPLAHAGIPLRRHVFVIGLEEGRVFPPAIEDPILLDAERSAIHNRLALSTDRIDEAVFGVVARVSELLSAPDVRLCLSYSCRDTRQFRETYASWLMLQVYRGVTGNPRAPYRDLHAALGRPVSVVPEADRAPSIGRWWLRGTAASASDPARAAVFGRFPSLAAGAHAASERSSDRFTAFDGYVPGAGPMLDPAAPGAIVSPTRLEGVAKCPYRFFLERGLGVRAIDAGERSRDVWLDPLIRGSLLHDLYAAGLRRARDERRRMSVDGDRDWLRAEARRRLADLAREMPPPSDDVEQRESADLLADIDLFVEAEAALDPAREPVGFEVSFGHGAGGHGEGESLASPTPVEIAVGDLRFRLTGRIDRIDRVAGASGPVFRIVDYKTGSFFKDDYQGTFAGGRLLQHALYGLAVAELLRRAGADRTIDGAEYYFSSARGRQHRQFIPSPSASDVAAVLSALRRLVVEGAFVHAPSAQACKFCDYQHACGKTAHDEADAKQGDAVLDAWRRLAAHG